MATSSVHAAETAVHQRDMSAIKKLKPGDFWIRTVSAKKFYPKRPELNNYDIADIAHATARVNRYNGHMDHPYSVGQHSVYVCELVIYEATYGDLGAIKEQYVDQHLDDEAALAILGLQALMHDATEAYIPDMPSPIKLLLPDFMEMEDKIAVSIAEAFDLPVELPEIVHRIDKEIRGTEIKHLFTSLKGDDVWAKDLHPDLEITPWPPAYTTQRFLKKFYELEAQRYA